MAPKTAKSVNPEWSFMVDAEKLTSSPLKITIQPNPEERKLLAQRLGLKALDALKADIEFEGNGLRVHVNGSFTAQVKQDCVITGKPVKSEITDSFEAWFADKSRAVPLERARREKEVKSGKGEMPILDESEDPEPLEDGKINAGELVTQFLSLAIDPYPHAEGAVYEPGGLAQAPENTGFDNPFAALKDWKGRKAKDE